MLGICLGMQLFATMSEENNGIKTLNIINIPVKKIRKHHALPLPHMGWNNITIPKKHSLFTGIQTKHYFYFAHSYCIEPCYATISQTEYGQIFSAIIEYKNFLGVQFHPEKSGMPGQQLIKNFLEI